MRLDELDYDLPGDLIATTPHEPRDEARLMVVRSDTGNIEHHRISDLPDLLEPSDVLVRNRSRVLPARLEGHRVESGGRISGLFLREIQQGTWVVMLRSNGRLRPGSTIQLEPGGHQLKLIRKEEKDWVVEVQPKDSAASILASCGRTPLPPYILRARGDMLIEDEVDRDWYQTVYAREEGSVAAPTAGLHFTPALEQTLKNHGLQFLEVVLHVGQGTFLPVTAPTLETHPMHSEDCCVEHAVLEALMSPDRSGRIVAVGTTTARVLESLPAELPDSDWSASTNLMIAPPWQWRYVDVLLTNFHLPRSTLLALVAARIGLPLMKEAYALAVDSGYRFYSYGDAMLLL
ncbi:MAG: tRNA preQ1(34) S-adenosylmethionine ribosyltransferase-isomerase QueA [Phycisphaerales bacterium]|nr:tRNA preQ1(34) S-adenosylmethionine ribosyltransferase-isomerase QueA [Phycisphaerales bacterium]